MSVFVIIVALLLIGRSVVEAQKEYQAEVKNDTREEFVIVNIETYYSIVAIETQLSESLYNEQG